MPEECPEVGTISFLIFQNSLIIISDTSYLKKIESNMEVLWKLSCSKHPKELYSSFNS
jgi:hypothetical protein